MELRVSGLVDSPCEPAILKWANWTYYTRTTGTQYDSNGQAYNYVFEDVPVLVGLYGPPDPPPGVPEYAPHYIVTAFASDAEELGSETWTNQAYANSADASHGTLYRERVWEGTQPPQDGHIGPHEIGFQPSQQGFWLQHHTSDVPGPATYMSGQSSWQHATGRYRARQVYPDPEGFSCGWVERRSDPAGGVIRYLLPPYGCDGPDPGSATDHEYGHHIQTTQYLAPPPDLQGYMTSCFLFREGWAEAYKDIPYGRNSLENEPPGSGQMYVIGAALLDLVDPVNLNEPADRVPASWQHLWRVIYEAQPYCAAQVPYKWKQLGLPYADEVDEVFAYYGILPASTCPEEVCQRP